MRFVFEIKLEQLPCVQQPSFYFAISRRKGPGAGLLQVLHVP